jgi:hypothetical protein
LALAKHSYISYNKSRNEYRDVFIDNIKKDIMEKSSIGDMVKAQSKEIDPFVDEISVCKQLIKERMHRLDLIRELLSNAGSVEVGATNIEINYTLDKDGHIFEIKDNGCGMNYTGNRQLPGRLDKFLGLGLSGIIGVKADEFSWKGIGSKLTFQSKEILIETCAGDANPFYSVTVNDPWGTINRNSKPKPRITEHPSGDKGTRIRVTGHPPHRQGDQFSFDEIKMFLLHRTFVGFTRKREKKPTIDLSVVGKTETLKFGFPEFAEIDFDSNSFKSNGLYLDEKIKTLFINMSQKKQKSINVCVKGFLTWDAEKYNLSANNYNTGLILSVKGIPYFKLNMAEYGASSIITARPGENKSCLIVECDSIQEDMNISRSGLVDSEKTLEFKNVVSEIFYDIESSIEYLTFRKLQEKEKFEKQSDILADEKRKIEDIDQNWVVLEEAGKQPMILIREPKNEEEVNALIWKLEALGALPFERFNTLAYIGASKGPDLLVNFQEEKGSEPQRSTVIEIENNFYNYKTHGHVPSQYPKVICWDMPSSGRKIKPNKTLKPHKFTFDTDEFQVHIFVLKFMTNIKVYSRKELLKKGISI